MLSQRKANLAFVGVQRKCHANKLICDMSEKSQACICWRSEEMPRQQTDLWHVRERPSFINFDKQLCKLYTSRGHKTCTNRFCTHSASKIILILYQTGNILYGKLRFKIYFTWPFFRLKYIYDLSFWNGVLQGGYFMILLQIMQTWHHDDTFWFLNFDPNHALLSSEWQFTASGNNFYTRLPCKAASRSCYNKDILALTFPLQGTIAPGRHDIPHCQQNFLKHKTVTRSKRSVNNQLMITWILHTEKKDNMNQLGTVSY
jgi:hypothetical protein